MIDGTGSRFGRRVWTGVVLGAAVVSGVGGPSARALVVEAEGTVVFDSGGFEDGVVGVFPVSPKVGTYRFNQEAKVTVTRGASEIEGGPNGAHAGEHYLTVDRVGGGSLRVAEFAEAIDPRERSFTVKWADWGQGGFTAYSLGEPGADGTAGATEGLLSSFGVHSGGDGPDGTRFVSFNSKEQGGTKTLDLPYEFGRWNAMRFAWDADAKQATLTVNGKTVEIDVHDDTLPASVGQFFFRGNAGGAVIFMDSLADRAAEPE